MAPRTAPEYGRCASCTRTPATGRPARTWPASSSCSRPRPTRPSLASCASPRTAACFLLQAGDEHANEYLAMLMANRGDGSLPTVAPFEVFEIAWVLYNLARAELRPAEAQPLVRYLAQALTDDGVGVSMEGLRPDSDDTALTLSVLHRYRFPISAGPLRPFDGVNFFSTFPLERGASVTANAHVLEVLQAAPP